MKTIVLVQLLFVTLLTANCAPAPAPTAARPPTQAPTRAPEVTRATEATPAPSAALTVARPAPVAADAAPMVSIPAGEFLMGSEDNDREANNDEKPAHKVSLAPFSIDKFEVTNAQYQRCVQAGKCPPPAQARSATRPAYFGNSTFDNYPVIFVSWFDAKAYCEWAGKRLPTEAEWEHGARGNDSRLFPWGSVWDGGKLNSCDRNCQFDYRDTTLNDGQAETAPVGSYTSGASPFGLMDMSGNVSEWVADWYAPAYYATLPKTNPKGPASGQEKTVRGGAWTTTKIHSRTTNRERTATPDWRSDDIGFRCVKDPSL